MKILMIIPAYKPANVYGGPVEAVANLAESLVTIGHEVTVYATTANGKKELEVEIGKEYNVENVKVTYFRRIIGGHNHLSPELFRRLSSNVNRYDIIHIHSWWNLVTMPATWVCLSKGIKPFISPRGTLTGYTFNHHRTIPKHIVHSLAGRRLLERSILLFTSPREKEEALKFIQPRENYILPNIHQFPPSQRNLYKDRPYLKIIFLGRIDPAKNLEFLLRLVTQYLKIPYQLIIIGNGDPKYKQQLMESCMGNDQIQWIGHIEGMEKYERLADSDIMVLPSHTENYGNVVLESLSQGTPVLISPNVGLKDYITTFSLGWVAETKEEIWAKVLEEVWLDKSLLYNVQLRALERMQKEFDPLENAMEYINVYSKHIREQAFP